MRKLFIAAAGAALLLLGVVSPARAADVSPEAELGFQQISQCLQSRNDLAVLLVVDESGSLQETDPENKRAKLLANLVRSLGRQAGTPTANGAREINLAVSTFANEYRPLVPWTELGEASSASIATQLESEIPTLNQGGGTNHPEALSGARNQMAAITAASAAEQPPCQVAIFFTDGVLSVSDVQEENDAAANEMCRPGGVVDGVRRDGINLVSVMLFDPATARAAPTEYEQGRDLLKAAAEGKAGSRSCGTLPIPPTYARGAYLEGGVDKLASLFASAFALSQGATLIALEGSPTTVVIDPGITSFSVIGLAPRGIVLTNPGGTKIALANGDAGGKEAAAVWDFDNVTVNVPVTAGSQGTWTVTRPGQQDPVSVFLNTGLGIKLGDVSLVSGEKANIEGTIVRPGSKEPVDLSVYRDARMTASAVGAATDPLKLNDDGTFSGTVTPEGDGTSAQFDVTLSLTTASGQVLQPVAGRFTLPVTLPKEFPSVSPAKLVLSPLVGRRGKAEGQITVQGSAEGPTKVCVQPVQWSALDDPARYSTNQTNGCFDLAANESRTIDVAVQSNEASDERVGGQLPLSLTSAKNTQRDITVPVAFVATRPLNQAVRIGVVALLALLALLFPLALLYFVNRRLAKFRLADGSRSVAVPAAVATTGIRARVPVGAPAGEGAPVFGLPVENLRVVPPLDKPPREMPGPDGSSLRARMPRSIFGTPTAEVVAGPGTRVFSNQQPFLHQGGKSAPISLGLGDVWYVSVNDSDLLTGNLEDGIPSVVSAFVPPSGSGDSAASISDKVRQFPRFGSILNQLHAAAAADAAQANSGGGGRSSSSPSSPGPANGSARRPGGPSGPSGPSGPAPGGSRPSGPSGPSGPAPGGSRPSGPAPRPRGPQ